MDGLDIYIEDYNVSEPIPEEMLTTLNHARGLLFDVSEEQGAAPETAMDCDNLTADGQNVPVVLASPAASTEKQ